MRKPTIKKYMSDVIDELCKFKNIKSYKIDMEKSEFGEILRGHTFIAGGAIASLVRGEEDGPSDFDLYVDDIDKLEVLTRYYAGSFTLPKESCEELAFERTNKGITIKNKETNEPINCMVCQKQKSLSSEAFFINGPSEIKYNKITPVALTPNAITLRGKEGLTIQLVTRFSGDPEYVIDKFDFAHTMNYYYQDDLVFKERAMEALLTDELIYTGSQFPLCALIRTRKFLERGYSITAGTYLKIAMDIANTDMQDVEVLKAQMTGVDVVYFEEVIKEIEKTSSKGIVDIETVKDIVDNIDTNGLNLI